MEHPTERSSPSAERTPDMAPPPQPSNIEDRINNLERQIALSNGSIEETRRHISEIRQALGIRSEEDPPSVINAEAKRQRMVVDLERAGERAFDSLYEELRRKGNIVGSSKVYSAEELIDLIGRVRGGQLSLDYITSTDGLRTRVENLIKAESGNRAPVAVEAQRDTVPDPLDRIEELASAQVINMGSDILFSQAVDNAIRTSPPLSEDDMKKLLDIINGYKYPKNFVQDLSSAKRLYDAREYLSSKLNNRSGGRLEVPVPEVRRSVDNSIRVGNFSEVSIQEVSSDQADEILSQARIQGDSFKGRKLTPEILKQKGLEPKHEVRIGNVKVRFSNIYQLGEGRIAVTAYVEKNGQTSVNTYYRSNSQGAWRYLPGYAMEGDEIDWYSKGYGEESINLPIALQKALSNLMSSNVQPLEIENVDLVFAGTAPTFDVDTNKGAYYAEVESTPKILGNFYNARGKVPPESLQLPREKSPDFSNVLTTWSQETSLYGMITAEVFQSMDGKLNYVFYKDRSGRVWIGGIEDDSEIQSNGLRKSWVTGGDLVTPAYEYSFQAGRYGNGEMYSGDYVDMFANYISKIPVIQEYLAKRVNGNRQSLERAA